MVALRTNSKLGSMHSRQIKSDYGTRQHALESSSADGAIVDGVTISYATRTFEKTNADRVPY